MISGVTHPQILRREGYKYRMYLQNLATELGVQDSVIFRNRFVSPRQLVELIGGADIYITPYKHKGQVVSGTLAYALSAGKAIISTPYLHAIELLDDQRGVLVPFDDPQAIAEKTIGLLDNGTDVQAMRKRAYLDSRNMVWDRVAQQYMGSFERVYNERLRNPRATFSAQNTEKALDRLPAVKLDHLRRMTDHTGIEDHAVFTVPNYPEGYSTDDNARALIVAILLEELGSRIPAGSSDLAARYLAFLWLAFDPTTKRFRNCLSYERQWQEPEGSEDSHGRALWGLGTVLGRSKDAGLRGAAGRLFELAIPAGLRALDWLGTIQRCEIKGHFVPIGSHGFYSWKTEKARFDQQPVEACAVVSACLQAYRATGKSRWRKEAWSAFNWFLGDNDLQIALYDPATGGCRDGLHPDRANENQGAESTLSFMMALLEMRELEEADGTESNLQ